MPIFEKFDFGIKEVDFNKLPLLRTRGMKKSCNMFFCGRSIAILLTLFSLMTFTSRQCFAEVPAYIDMRLLVISADAKEPIFGGITSILDQIGVPYDTLVATQSLTPFSAATLSDGVGHGRYQGIMLTTGNLGYQTSAGNFESAFTAAQWQALWNYERDFRVRQATLYTFPGGLPDAYGLILNSAVDTTATPIQANLTADGVAVFNYLNATEPLKITYAYTYLATPVSSGNPKPLLLASGGYAIASIYTYPDGRQSLAITADGNANLTHTLSLGYGVINWVSKGFFLGARKTYLSAQPDDVLIDDDIWNPTLGRESGTFRISGNDYLRLIDWKNSIRNSNPNAINISLEMPFNGVGASGIYPNDSLTPTIQDRSGAFKWISHTYTHQNLDVISYADATTELRLNDKTARTLGFSKYHKDSMIQPDISGLNNPEFLRAASDFGIRYILSDTSVPGWANPSPNAGRYSNYQPNILIIPRHPTNLYYNVSTPDEWVSEYNYFYGITGIFSSFGRNLSYAEVLDNESEIMLRYLLKFDVDPLMFHQPNLRAYDGTHSLLGDLISTTLNKYNKIFNLPIESLSQHDIGAVMAKRMAYDKSGVTATLQLGSSNTIFMRTINSVIVPFTGISFGKNIDIYGGQSISNIKMDVNSTLLIPAPSW